MPIPSVPSTSSTSIRTNNRPTIIVRRTATGAPTSQQQQQKCKYFSSSASALTKDTNDPSSVKNLKGSDAVEDAVVNVNDKEVQRYKKQKTLLLHARREDDDKVVNLTEERLRPISISGLYPGSKFHGTQKCGTASYEVNVELLHVDMGESTLSGYLKIKGLTSEFPELTTFFEAEVIGPKYSFHTRKWQADQKSDLLHWKKFPPFKPYIDIFNSDNFVFDLNDDHDYMYMRWKETFLVPNHHVSAIHGASFAGFYYICYQRSTNQIKGFYFFRNHKDWFQELTLAHIPDRAFGKFEFR